jgi:CheY-like chemotaxis protein
VSRAGHEILLVEDDDDQRSALRDVLNEEGFAVVETSNGQTALEYLLSHRQLPGVILLDLNMPVMSGAEFLRVVQSYLRIARIPIAVMTGERSSTVDGGSVVGHLTKPFTIDELLALVRKFVSPLAVPEDARGRTGGAP